jgi:hypothetical protein
MTQLVESLQKRKQSHGIRTARYSGSLGGGLVSSLLSSHSGHGGDLRLTVNKVLDEAHIIKNRKTKTARACNELVAERRWCLTGWATFH